MPHVITGNHPHPYQLVPPDMYLRIGTISRAPFYTRTFSDGSPAWIEMDGNINPGSEGNVLLLGVDAGNANIAYGVGRPLLPDTFSGYLRSSYQGSWVRVSTPGDTNLPTSTAVVDPSFTGRLVGPHLSSDGSGGADLRFCHSSSGGATWSKTGVILNVPSPGISEAYFDFSESGDMMWGMIQRTTTLSKLAYSLDGGFSWSFVDVHSLFKWGFGDRFFADAYPGCGYITSQGSPSAEGLWRTEDYGATWDQLLAISNISGGNESIRKGGTFNAVPEAGAKSDILRVVDSAKDIHTSVDAGANWNTTTHDTAIDSVVGGHFYLYTLNPNLLYGYIGMATNPKAPADIIWISQDEGATWTPKTGDIPSTALIARTVFADAGTRPIIPR